MWSQKLAQDPSHPVVWDYHVILLLKPKERNSASLGESDEFRAGGTQNAWVYDFDTRLGIPISLPDYLQETFSGIPLMFESLFRIVPGDVFCENFASDRSHMLDKNVMTTDGLSNNSDEMYIYPPPKYPPICGSSAKGSGKLNNLMSFVCMESSEETFGGVVDIAALSEWCAGEG